MGKVINIVDKDNKLVASISSENVILHKEYKVIETNEDEACFCDSDGTIELLRPELSI